jgi:hypothetical protein
MKYVVLFLQIMINPFQLQDVPKNDPRPPVIQSKLTDAEQTALSLAEKDVAEKQALLELAQQRLDKEKYRIIDQHRTKETGEYFACGQLAYIPSIERAWVVFRLGYPECKGA